jgi:hypothetical protein
VRESLKNMVIIIDPCVNPDGRDRYANFYNQFGSQPFNPDPQTIEHLEPWPGGRQNHYLFDLNRDWAWQTQIESKERIKEYNKWLPHVHVDFHEQGYNSPYYFAPAAEPYHELITKWQRDFQVTIGKNNAKYFDENNWFYFTKQYFDLLYPSYGDTYPTYNGAIGMTYEQAGHGLGGLGVLTQEGDTLTLQDRLKHHTVTGLSTIEITSKNAHQVVSEFEKFFKTPVPGVYKSFVLKGGNKDKIKHLTAWLDAQGITYGFGGNQKGLKGFHYGSAQERTFNVDKDDLVVNVNQPKGTLTKILFEPQTKLSDSLTYDITAWAVPYIYGLEAFATSVVLPMNATKYADFQPNTLDVADPYAYVFKWGSFKDAQFLSAILKAGVKVRFTNRPINSKGNEFGRGSLVIAKRDNAHYPSLNETVMRLANVHQRNAYPLTTGFMDGGPDIGSSDIRYLRAPRIAMLAGNGTYTTEVGALWYYMEQDLQYPAALLWTDRLGRTDLSDYDVLLLQEGSYQTVDQSGLNKIDEWVRAGGKLILFQDAIGKFADSDFASISRYDSEEQKKAMEKQNDPDDATKLLRYEDRERESAKDLIPGAVFRVHLDNSHPMAFGYGDTFYSLKTTGTRYGYLNTQNVGVIKSTNDHLSGFVGKSVKANMPKSMVFGVENRGRGQIVYFADNVLFRAFWQNGKLMVANSIFFVGQ